MNLWPRICPVCGWPLPERGNRRLYVPWKAGYRLVHADFCAEVVEAQQVLELQPPKRSAGELALLRNRRWYVAGKRLVAERPEHVVHRRPEAIERMLAVARHSVLAERQRVLVDSEEPHLVCHRGQELIRIARAALHEREVSAAHRTELFT